LNGNTELAKITQAINALGAILGPSEGGQKHGGEDGDDGDNHEQFNERKSASPELGEEAGHNLLIYLLK
jgi:hypothetical protein